MNTTFLDKKYIRFLSNRLRNFRDKGNDLFEFSHECERENSRKRRGYFYPKGHGYNFFCHNCQESTKFSSFLEKHDPLLYKEYRLEVFADNKPIVSVQDKKIIHKEISVPSGLVCFRDLREDHPAWKFVQKRKLPKERYSDLYLCKDFYNWAASINKTFENVNLKEPRLVLEYKNKDGKEIGFTCRSFGKSVPKYIELKLSDEEMIYGLEYIDTTKDILTVEGPLDSLFLDNCIAVGGASYKSEFLNKYKTKIIIIPDNDWKRNIHVCKQIIDVVNRGFRVSLLPDTFVGKDINDGILNGLSKSEIQDIIFKSVKQGPSALLEISTRRKC